MSLAEAKFTARQRQKAIARSKKGKYLVASVCLIENKGRGRGDRANGREWKKSVSSGYQDRRRPGRLVGIFYNLNVRALLTLTTERMLTLFKSVRVHVHMTCLGWDYIMDAWILSCHSG